MIKNNLQKGFSGPLVVGIIACVVAVVIMFGYYASKKDSSLNSTTSMELSDKALSEDAMVKPTDTMEKDETSMVDKGDAMMKSGTYEAYAGEKLSKAETGDVVLFFHASWCPSCRGLNSSIESNLDSIPLGVTILKTDYDKETELKKKYGVTYQHTLVQVDKDGNMIKKWSGSPSLDKLLAQIQ